MTAPERPPRTDAGPSDIGRTRSLWPAILLITGVVALSVVVFVAVYPDDGTGTSTPRSEPWAPRIIERPEEGRGPEQPGDPGGWQQLALLGVVVAGLGTVTVLVWRSSRRAGSGAP